MHRLFVILMLLLLSLPIIAQTDNTKPTAADSATAFAVAATAPTKYVLRVGPTLGIVSGGIALDNAEGRKVNHDFWFLQNYGIMVFAPFSKTSKIGGRLDLGISTVGTRTRPYEFFDSKTGWKGYTIERYTYFTIAPQISLYGVMVGAGFNFPMKGEMWHPTNTSTKFIVDKSTMTTAIDLRIGGAINLWDSDIGILTIDLLAKYWLTGLYNDGTYTNGYPVNNLGVPLVSNTSSSVINLAPVSVHLGLSYQFKLGI